MAKNVEIKIGVPATETFEFAKSKASELGSRGPFTLQQIDYFFPVPNGRLKLRVETSDLPEHPEKSELIAYIRSDEAAARYSDYLLYPTNDPEVLRESLTRSLGAGPVVRKTRELYLSGRTRIHFDTVQDLGTFVEIEVVMEDGEPESIGQMELATIVEQLGLEAGDFVDIAYADLILQSQDLTRAR